MKTKKPKKRWDTPNQLRDEIDRYKVKAQKYMDSAAALDSKADTLFKTGDAKLAEDASFAREMAKKHRRSAQRIYDKRLPYLGQKLAEMLTPNLPNSGFTERSVQA